MSRKPSFFRRLLSFLVSFFVPEPQATNFALVDIESGEEQTMPDIVLTAVHPQAFKRIVPNKGDTDVVVISKKLNGSDTGDANVELAPYASAPGDALKFQLTRLNPTPTPAVLEIVIQPDTTDPLTTITHTYNVIAKPDEADDFDLADIE